MIFRTARRGYHVNHSLLSQQSVLDDLSQLLIPFSQISFDNKVELGVGGYGVVFLALLSRSPAPPTNVAVKQLRIGQVEEDRRRTATVSLPST